MTNETVKAIFGVDDVILLANNTQVEVEVFAELFANVPENPTYQDFVDADGGRLGYIPFFDKCKAAGILE